MRTLFIVVTLALFACNNNNSGAPDEKKDTSIVSDTKTVSTDPQPLPDPLTDTLLNLPFIIKSHNYIDSISNHKMGIALLKDTSDTEITVRAGYNGPERFETYYTLIIDRKTGEIKVADPISGDDIPLKEYLKNN